MRKANAVAGVGLADEILPSPSIAARAEQKIDETAERKDVVADEEILEIQHAGAFAERLKVRPDIKAKDTGKRQEDDEEHAPANDDLAVDTKKL